MATTRNMIGEKWEEVMGWHGVAPLQKMMGTVRVVRQAVEHWWEVALEPVRHQALVIELVRVSRLLVAIHLWPSQPSS